LFLFMLMFLMAVRLILLMFLYNMLTVNLLRPWFGWSR